MRVLYVLYDIPYNRGFTRMALPGFQRRWRGLCCGVNAHPDR